jgi:predicted nicotinamide N-methyase
VTTPINLSLARDQPQAFVRANTLTQSTALLPELQLYLAHELFPLWQLTESDLSETGLPPPYWAFAWAGGQALARYVLDNPQIVRGKRVLDFATGSGLVAIAAAKAGAASVVAADVDPLARAACQLNAQVNQVEIESVATDYTDATTQPSELRDLDLILSGDVFYEQPMATLVGAWMRRAANCGHRVIVGDPQRYYFPKHGVQLLARYAVATTRELEDSDVRSTSVWQMLADPKSA